MPTRAIAAVLLRAEGAVPHQELYTMADEYGLFNSRRRFKHCLKMMRQIHCIRVRCTGPEYPGASTRGFVVELTRRDDAVYKHYLGETPPPPGLTDALDEVEDETAKDENSEEQKQNISTRV